VVGNAPFCACHVRLTDLGLWCRTWLFENKTMVVHAHQLVTSFAYTIHEV
jgi:hypothetical protein